MPATASMAADPRRSTPLPHAVADWWQWLNSTSSRCRSSPLVSSLELNSSSCSAASGRRRRVLIISYQFPPTGGSGVQRPAKLAKYLSEFGWTVEVLTAGHQRFPWRDATLLADLPDELVVHRVAGHEPACLAGRLAGPCDLINHDLAARCADAIFWRLTRWVDRLEMHGGESLWIGPALRAALRSHRQRPFDAVISTGPPHFAHRVGSAVARKTGLPWLADIRDPLVSDFDRTSPPARRLRRMRRLEAAIVASAAGVITTCPSFARELQQRYPDRADAVQAITNGFDRDDLAGCLDPHEILRRESSECAFLAAGSFYGRRELASLIDPLRQVLNENPRWRGRVRLIVAGSLDAQQRHVWDRHKPDWVTFAGYLEHRQVIALAATAACNILVVPACEHGHMSIPGKTFELLALPAHVLALVPAGSDAEHIVRRAGAATVARLENQFAVSAAMKNIIELHFARRLAIERNWHRLDAFDRRVVAARFARRLDSICPRSPARGQVSTIEPHAAEVA